MITIQVNDREVLDVIAQLAARVTDMRPAMREIGKNLVESTKQRFVTATGPDGAAWAANSPATIGLYVAAVSGSFKKDGQLSKKGAIRKAAKNPLTGESRALQTEINYQLAGNTGVSIGSPMPYAAMQQFGGKKSAYPHLWGDIPARPFLGVSKEDAANIVEIVSSYLVK